MGKAVWGKTLGIVGLGHIGKAVARRACGFSMRLLAFEFDAFWDAEFAARYNIERTDLDTLLRESDYVSLHLRISASTLGIIGARELALMKPTAYLINTARASLVDEKALYDALATRHIAGAGLDTVIDSGPDNPLIGLPNVVCTPHLGNRCIDSVHDVVDTAIDNALAVLRGKRPNYVVNPEVYSLCYPQPHQPHLYPS
jgi:phosphoglycerate dehydrogenase-like enzyme